MAKGSLKYALFSCLVLIGERGSSVLQNGVLEAADNLAKETWIDFRWNQHISKQVNRLFPPPPPSVWANILWLFLSRSNLGIFLELF